MGFEKDYASEETSKVKTTQVLKQYLGQNQQQTVESLMSLKNY